MSKEYEKIRRQVNDLYKLQISDLKAENKRLQDEMQSLIKKIEEYKKMEAEYTMLRFKTGKSSDFKKDEKVNILFSELRSSDSAVNTMIKLAEEFFE